MSGPVARVLKYLAQAEVEAPVSERDDLRVAWITVLKASEGNPEPFTTAFWQYYGRTPQELIPFWVARAWMHQHCVGAPFDRHLPFRFTSDWPEQFARVQAEVKTFAPKKPCASVRDTAERKKAA